MEFEYSSEKLRFFTKKITKINFQKLKKEFFSPTLFETRFSKQSDGVNRIELCVFQRIGLQVTMSSIELG